MILSTTDLRFLKSCLSSTEIIDEELASAFTEIVTELREKYGDEWIKHIMS